MEDKVCDGSHALKGSKVKRTTYMTGYVVRERVCAECGKRVDTVERGVGAITRDRARTGEVLEREKERGRGTHEAVLKMAIAVEMRKSAEKEIAKIAEGIEG